ncbi:MAG: alpha-glucosidase C-terminal domain-containing protein [Candidatus Eisenbacteria bacterium]|nr:alpha-glucosidase C-terminal domain-containing protein [Candidatus Eisenbacteria bacterium]
MRRPGLAALALLLTALVCAPHAPAVAQPGGALTALASPEWVRHAVVYEVFPRVHGPRGRLSEVTADLERIRDLGATCVWLMPVHPIGVERRKGTYGSPYSVRDYFAVDSALGGEAELRELVAKAHATGLKVIMDWVANHTAWDNPLRHQHPGWYTRDAGGNVRPPDPAWWDVIDLDFDDPGLRAWMIGAMRHWVADIGVDGFRCDAAGMVPLAFWVEARRALQQVKPDLLLLGECDGPQYHVAAFDMTYDWGLWSTLQSVRGGRADPAFLVERVLRIQADHPKGSLKLRFIENHDERRAADRFGRDWMRAGLAFLFTSEGCPLLYAGEEVGVVARPGLFEREPVPWTTGDPELSRYVAQLARVRREQEALATGATGKLEVNVPDRVCAFLRTLGDEQVLVAINFSGRPAGVILDDPRLDRRGGVELLSGREVRLRRGLATPLEPWETLIVPLGRPD